MHQTIGKRIVCNILYICVTLSDILSAYLSANDLGNISQKIKTNNVTMAVDIPMAAPASHQEIFAISMLILAANDAAAIFTILFPMSMVMSNLSPLLFRCLSVNAVLFPFLIRAFILWNGTFINASSVHEKKADHKMSIIKPIISPECMSSGYE